MVPEAPFESTETGLVQTGPGWFVVSARDAAGATRKAAEQSARSGMRRSSPRSA